MAGWVFSQIGAREHYALPRAAHCAGLLHRFYTDFWAGPLVRRLRSGPATLRALAGRFHEDLPPDRVTAFCCSTLLHQALERRARRKGNIAELGTFVCREGARFASMVARHLRNDLVAGKIAGFVGYDTGCLETQLILRDHGIPTVVNQIDPARVEDDLVTAEREKWPGWQAAGGHTPEVYFSRLKQEWDLADKVIVNSLWSKNALIGQGVPGEKLAVMPLAYEPSAAPHKRTRNDRGPFTVLWLGQVNLRKGIQYLLQAAKQCENDPIRFVVAGPINLTEAAIATAPANVSFLGRVTRDTAAELYHGADVFVLPTLSDGFAITQIEAMAHGLPVITTPNCGNVVTPDQDGLIIAAGDPDALTAAILRLAGDRQLVAHMAAQAVEKSKLFSINHLARQLADLLNSLAPVATQQPG